MADSSSGGTFTHRLGYWSCHFNVLAVSGVLIGALLVQFVNGELPCPLCMTQRMGMFLALVGACSILLAAKRGWVTATEYASGFGMSILGAVVGGAGSLRQIALHVCGNDPGYGEPVLGFHLYTWAFVVFATVVTISGLNMLFCRWLEPHPVRYGWATRGTVLLVVVLMCVNLVAIIAEVGFHAYLPDNPTNYRLFEDLGWTSAPRDGVQSTSPAAP